MDALTALSEELGLYDPDMQIETTRGEDDLQDMIAHSNRQIAKYVAKGDTVRANKWRTRRQTLIAREQDEAAFRDHGITLQSFGGACPMQAEGTFDGASFYFRVRWSWWEVAIDPTGEDAIDVSLVNSKGFYRSGDLGDGGWTGIIPDSQAYRLIFDAIQGYRRERDAGTIAGAAPHDGHGEAQG